MQERVSNDALYAFANVPLTNKEIQRIYSHRKYSMLKNMLKPKTTCDGDLCVMSAVEAANNSSLPG